MTTIEHNRSLLQGEHWQININLRYGVFVCHPDGGGGYSARTGLTLGLSGAVKKIGQRGPIF
jgi:hypothetical protein